MSVSNAFEPTGTTMTIGTMAVLNWVTITPPAWDGGEAIDITNLANQKYMTKMAKTLIDIGEISFTAEYAPHLISAAPINVESDIVIFIPYWGSWTLRGYLRSIKPDELKVGERAMCSGEIVVTNTTVSGTGPSRTVTETGPVWASSSASAMAST